MINNEWLMIGFETDIWFWLLVICVWSDIMQKNERLATWYTITAIRHPECRDVAAARLAMKDLVIL